MNNKNLFVILALMSLCTMTLSACGDSSDENNMPETTAAVNNYVKQDTDTVVTGEVTKITGNKVTLALGTLSKTEDPADEGGEPPVMGKGEMPDMSGEFPDTAEGEMPSFGGGRHDSANGEKPDFSGERPDMAEGGSRDFAKGRRSAASVEKSGENAEYIIPVGMPIDGLSGRSSDYSGISAGTVLTLTVNADGVVCAASAE